MSKQQPTTKAPAPEAPREDIAQTAPRRYYGIQERLMGVDMALGALRLHLADAKEAATQGLPPSDDPAALPRHRLLRALESALATVDRASLEITGGACPEQDVWGNLARSSAAVAVEGAKVDLSDL